MLALGKRPLAADASVRAAAFDPAKVNALDNAVGTGREFWICTRTGCPKGICCARSTPSMPGFCRLHQKLAPYYSSTGRPSIDPELMIRMLIIGYCHGIRSEWRLCDEVGLNLAYRWFL
jgi:hypothetical protein